MFNVYIIGAGQIGSRHFQALKRVKFPLSVTVVDPSEQSLAVAKKRYEEMPKGRYRHEIKYLQEIDTGQKIDLIILATTSNVRAKIIKDVLKKNQRTINWPCSFCSRYWQPMGSGMQCCTFSRPDFLSYRRL